MTVAVTRCGGKPGEPGTLTESRDDRRGPKFNSAPDSTAGTTVRPCPGCPDCRPCENCGGSGEAGLPDEIAAGVSGPCPTCNGTGVAP